jgi:Raf kinase inhibitor-like YbhB/YbcL family protein
MKRGLPGPLDCMGKITLALLLLAGLSLPTLEAREDTKMAELKISSPVFENNGAIPKKYTCDGADVNPPLKFENIPSAAKSLALIVDDPDAPGGTWVHWVVWNIEPRTGEIRENSVPAGALQGMNDFRKHDYGGPCPPSGTHRYFFKLYALDAPVSLNAGAKKTDLEKAMKGHIIAQAQVVGLYGRK